MTNEEAIKILSNRDGWGIPTGYSSGVAEAVNMAIEALKGNPKTGHWIEKIIYSHSYAECSECKTVYSWSETETMRFCKRCGVQMVDEVENV